MVASRYSLEFAPDVGGVIAWVGLSSGPENGLRASLGWQSKSKSKSKSFYESGRACSSESTDRCALGVLDSADIVRDAWFHQLSVTPFYIARKRLLIGRIFEALNCARLGVGSPNRFIVF